MPGSTDWLRIPERRTVIVGRRRLSYDAGDGCQESGSGTGAIRGWERRCEASDGCWCASEGVWRLLGSRKSGFPAEFGGPRARMAGIRGPGRVVLPGRRGGMRGW